MTSHSIAALRQSIDQLPDDEEIAWQCVESRDISEDVPPEVWANFVKWLEDSDWDVRVIHLARDYYQRWEDLQKNVLE